MRVVSLARRLVVPVALSAVVAACGSGTAPTKSPSDQLKAAAAAFGTASSFHLKGSIDHGGTPYTFDVAVGRPDSANGSVTLGNGQTAQFMVAGGAAFTHGPGVAALLDAVSKRVAGDRWVLLHNPGWQTALVKVAGSDNFVANFVSNQPGLVASSATVAGQKALKISNSIESIFVAATGPPVVLRIERTKKASAGTELGPVAVDIGAYGESVSAQTPADYVDFNYRPSLPAFYAVSGAVKFGSCRSDSCTVNATVYNQNGRIAPSLSASATFHFVRSDNQQEFDHCTTPIPLVGSGESETVSCSVSDSAWRNNQETFQVRADVSNPEWS